MDGIKICPAINRSLSCGSIRLMRQVVGRGFVDARSVCKRLVNERVFRRQDVSNIGCLRHITEWYYWRREQVKYASDSEEGGWS